MKKDVKILFKASDNTTLLPDVQLTSSIISGRDLLVQKIVKRILTAKGSNTYNPAFGSNFFNLFSVISPDTESEIKEKFPVLLEAIQDEIILDQIEDNTLNSSEKLISLILEDVKADTFLGSWKINIRVITEDGQNSSFSVT